jgi:hypothetical protein
MLWNDAEIRLADAEQRLARFDRARARAAAPIPTRGRGGGRLNRLLGGRAEVRPARPLDVPASGRASGAPS